MGGKIPRPAENLGTCEICASGHDPRYLYAEQAIKTCPSCAQVVCEAHWDDDEGTCSDCAG